MQPLTQAHVDKVMLGVQWLQSTFGDAPRIAIVTGSSGPTDFEGLGTFKEFPLPPNIFPQPEAKGHGKVIRLGEFNRLDTKVIHVPGRIHFNECGDAHEVVQMVRTLGLWGCEQFVITNLAGTVGNSRTLVPGAVGIINDHLDLFTHCNPMIGPPALFAKLGPTKYFGMTGAYSVRLHKIARSMAKESTFQRPNLYPVMGLASYAMVPGSHFETFAAKRVLWNAEINLAGMSTVPEAIALQHMGKEVAAFSLISNEVAGGNLSHEANLKAVEAVIPRFARFIAHFAEAIAELPPFRNNEEVKG